MHSLAVVTVRTSDNYLDVYFPHAVVVFNNSQQREPKTSLILLVPDIQYYGNNVLCILIREAF